MKEPNCFMQDGLPLSQSGPDSCAACAVRRVPVLRAEIAKLREVLAHINGFAGTPSDGEMRRTLSLIQQNARAALADVTPNANHVVERSTE